MEVGTLRVTGGAVEEDRLGSTARDTAVAPADGAISSNARVHMAVTAEGMAGSAVRDDAAALVECRLESTATGTAAATAEVMAGSVANDTRMAGTGRGTARAAAAARRLRNTLWTVGGNVRQATVVAPMDHDAARGSVGSMVQRLEARVRLDRGAARAP
ncbi:hypothetical protein C1H76_5627 [Elsinoe australis]|uniref:Uncharacterized protein n=1 Tax=Elsinoe australis TaxID=40998 RepID=A0A4U7AYY0_9PEZI|nr:hypothetical protein C1H76_5627 [Elsinoe australis]